MTATRIAAPRTVADVRDVLRDVHAAGETVEIRGGGTESSLGYPIRDVDLLVRTTLLDRVVDYAPADLVVEVEAGATLASLQTSLAPHGQRLALDPPEPERATIGGLLAANTYGPRRARFGSLRDLIVGISFVRADGASVRGGGKVVKNVAGFDLPKILVGSLGTLGLITSATFRLHPIPDRTRALCVAYLDAAGVRGLVREISAARLEPVAHVARHERGRYACYVVFEGFESGVAEQIDRFAAIARALGVAAEEVDPAVPAMIDRDARGFGDVRLRAAVPPAAFETLHRNLVEPFARELDRTEIVAYPSLGVAFASGYARDAAELVVPLGAMRRSCEAIGGNLVSIAIDSAGLAARFDPYGTLPPAFPLMHHLKERFDPGHHLNPGRFVGKL